MTEHTEESVRAEVRAWLDSNWDPDLTLLEWRNRLVDSGWGMPQWPKEWFGRELSVGLIRVIDEEFKRVDAITVARKGATTLAGQIILTHGSDMLKEKFLRRSLTGEDAWCQLFSEPGNGSDLAGAMTRAERVGNKYIVNGQKVWTTSAHLADYGLLLAR
ncbi:MAG: acyl-CoA dehydrogenase family protein, partial [Pseudomonadota bacterium]|nr:acyl-CoA dehydrogenase family protein [Pseudomonadota bacterium]